MKPIPAPPLPEDTPPGGLDCKFRTSLPSRKRAAEGRAKLEADKLRGPARHSAFARLRRAAAIVIPKFTSARSYASKL
jgi:hypothetical protein